MRISLLFLVLSFLSLQAISQINLDSLWYEWENTGNNDSIRSRALSSFIWNGPYLNETDTALILTQQLYQFNKTNQNKFGLIDALDLRGFLNFRKGSYSNALDDYNEALKICKKDEYPLRYADILLKTGIVYHENEDFIRAISYYERCLKIYQEQSDDFGISAIYNEFGSIYKDKGEFEKSLEYYKKSIEYNNKYRDEFGNISMYTNIGDLYFMQEKYDQSLEYFNKVLHLATEINEKISMASALSGIANIYVIQGHYEKALVQFKECLQINSEIEYTLGISNNYIDLGNIYFEKEDYEKSIPYYEKGLSLAVELGDLGNQKIATDALFRVYKAVGKEKKALSYLEQKLAVSEKIKSEETLMRLQQMEFSKKVEADSLKQIQKDLEVEMMHQTEIRKKNRNRNLAIGFGIFFLFISGGLYSRWSYIKKSKAILEKEKNRSENLLLNILPAEIAEELKEKGEAEARQFENVSILFTDFKGFTSKSEQMTAKELVVEINQCFKAFDFICEKYQIEKIKTIGDAYMAASGLPVESKSSAKNIVYAALEMQEFVKERIENKKEKNEIAFEMRLGIHTGPVVAGIVGVKKFQYDIWGDTVNTASRMESSGEIGKVNISDATYQLLKEETDFSFTSRGKIQAKGKGEIEMWFVERNQ